MSAYLAINIQRVHNRKIILLNYFIEIYFLSFRRNMLERYEITELYTVNHLNIYNNFKHYDFNAYV